MQFRVPKFLEREATIAFGLTFKKLAVVGGAALFLFLLYYVLPTALFAIMAVLVAGTLFLFIFIKIKGQSLFSVITKAFGFFLAPRIYFWQKKTGSSPIKVVKKKVKKEEGSILRLAPKSRLHEIGSKIDLGEASNL